MGKACFGILFLVRNISCGTGFVCRLRVFGKKPAPLQPIKQRSGKIFGWRVKSLQARHISARKGGRLCGGRFSMPENRPPRGNALCALPALQSGLVGRRVLEYRD
jgi:hypothetical protein